MFKMQEVKETQGTFFVKTLAESPLILISILGSYLLQPTQGKALSDTEG